VAVNSRAGGDEFPLELDQGFGDLGLDLSADAREGEEEFVEVATGGGVGDCEGSDDSAAFELVEGDSRPS